MKTYLEWEKSKQITSFKKLMNFTDITKSISIFQISLCLCPVQTSFPSLPPALEHFHIAPRATSLPSTGDIRNPQELFASLQPRTMAPHSSTLAWKIPWTEEPGGLQSMGSRRVVHNWATSLSLFTFMRWRRKWQPTPVFLPGESQGPGSLLGCRLWGRTESDTTEVTWQPLSLPTPPL